MSAKESRQYAYFSQAMKILIALNFTLGLLLAISQVVFEKYELIGLLSGMLLLPSFMALAIVNFVAIFFLWRKRHLRAFIPLGTYIVAAVLGMMVTFYGTQLVLRGTPCDPKSFLNHQVKSELTPLAQKILAEHQRNNFSPDIVAMAEKYNLKPLCADYRQGIVTFGYYHLRRWYQYIWATNGLTKPYSMDSTITDNDIEDWGELKRIIEQGDMATGEEKRRIVFAPSVAFPLLKDSLGEEFTEHIRNMATTTNDLSDEDKKLVLIALNKQRLASSALVENPQITYEKFKFGFLTSSGLCVAGDKYNGEVDGFWESRFARQLLSEGVLLYAPDGKHLKIKTDLTAAESREIEWLQVGLMNFIYGNLFGKQPYDFTKDLGDNWYFNVR